MNSCITVLGHYTVFDTSLSLHISYITEVTKYENCQGEPNLFKRISKCYISEKEIYSINLKSKYT